MMLRRRLRPDWGSHLPVLIKATSITTGDVVECGCGFFSTPFLHWACFNSNRNLYTYESDKEWLNFFSRFNTSHHKAILVSNWDDLDLSRACELAIIDHKPGERRWQEIIRLMHASMIVIHDVDKNFPNGRKNDRAYGHNKLKNLFTYQYIYTKSRVHTAVVSNFLDVQELFKDI